MQITIGISLILACVIVHELGHALAMHLYGITIKRLSIGINCPLRIRFRTKTFLGGTEFQITPLLVMAYVEPTAEGLKTMNRLPYRASADIVGAGPFANLVFALVLSLIVFVTTAGGEPLTATLLGALLLIAAITLLLLARKVIIRYVFPLLGVSILSWVLYGLFTHFWQTLGGPVTITKTIAQQPNIISVFWIAALVSASLGLTNLMPLGGLDGGKQFESIIRLVWPTFKAGRYQTLTMIFLLGILAVSIATDIRGCIH